MSYWPSCGWYVREFPGVTAKLSVRPPQVKITFGPSVARSGGGSVPCASARHFSIALAAFCVSGTPGDLLLRQPGHSSAGEGTFGRSNEPAGILGLVSILVATIS